MSPAQLPSRSPGLSPSRKRKSGACSTRRASPTVALVVVYGDGADDPPPSRPRLRTSATTTCGSMRPASAWAVDASLPISGCPGRGRRLARTQSGRVNDLAVDDRQDHLAAGDRAAVFVQQVAVEDDQVGQLRRASGGRAPIRHARRRRCPRLRRPAHAAIVTASAGSHPPAGSPLGVWRRTAAWISSSGSIGTTGQSLPNASTAPESSRLRRRQPLAATDGCRMSRQTSTWLASGRACIGCMLATTPRPAKRGRSAGCNVSMCSTRCRRDAASPGPSAS